MLDIKRALASLKLPERTNPRRLMTPWGADVETMGDCSRVLSEHPRPTLERARYTMLNGLWDYAIAPIDRQAAGGAANGAAGVAAPLDARTALDAMRAATPPRAFDGKILVPFSPEAPLSRVSRTLQPNEFLWYHRTVEVPAPAARERLLLHFDAVDWACTLWINGALAATHQNGYLPFDVDATPFLDEAPTADGGRATSGGAAGAGAGCQLDLVLCVYDPSDTGVQLRGKQTLNPGGMWYAAQSGIWQPVWCEVVPATYISALTLNGHMDGTLDIEASIAGSGREALDDLQLTVAVFEDVTDPEGASDPGPASNPERTGNPEPATDSEHAEHPPRASGRAGAACAATAEDEADYRGGRWAQEAREPVVCETFPLAECARPSRGDTCSRHISARFPVPSPHRWSPDDPYLYHVTVSLGAPGDPTGGDTVQSYCAFRSVEARRDGAGTPRVFLNGDAIFLRGVLDQGYWPDGLLTAPSDEAFVHDIEAMKSAGFNMMRKHLKVERARWYYHCDRLGMLVWQDAVTGGGAYNSLYVSKRPTVFMSSWGRFRDDTLRGRRLLSSDNPAYRREWQEVCTEMAERLKGHPSIITWVLFNEGLGQFDAVSMAEHIHTIDPSRPIDAASGWYDRHCGDYLSHHNYFRPLGVARDRGLLQGYAARRGCRAFVISEFGGWAQPISGHTLSDGTYGYGNFDTLEEWRAFVHRLLDEAEALAPQGLAGYVYTQVSDVEDEVNGILTYDRRVNKLGRA